MELRNIVIRVQPKIRQWIKQVALDNDVTLKDMLIEAVKLYEDKHLSAKEDMNENRPQNS